MGCTANFVATGVVVLAFAVTVGVVLTHAVPEGNAAIANVVLGTLAAMATQTVHYWLGSSAGSARKTEDLRAAQDALGQQHARPQAQRRPVTGPTTRRGPAS